MTPIPNMPLSAIFLLLAILNRHTIGMGKITISTSSSRFITATYISSDFWSPQEPLTMDGAHLYVIGRQMRQSAMTALKPKATFTPRDIQQAILNVLIGKICTYRTIIVARIIVTAVAQRTGDKNRSCCMRVKFAHLRVEAHYLKA